MTPLQQLLRQQEAPFVVPTDATIGVYRIENGEELQRVVKAKHLHDVASVVAALAPEAAWLVYMKEASGRSVVLAMSQSMREALV